MSGPGLEFICSNTAPLFVQEAQMVRDRKNGFYSDI